jgi:hypothetical protein
MKPSREFETDIQRWMKKWGYMCLLSIGSKHRGEIRHRFSKNRFKLEMDRHISP